MKSLENRNARAQEMYKEGGVWQVESRDGKMIDVVITACWVNALGIRVLEVEAVEGKPWMDKDWSGRRVATSTHTYRPEFLSKKEEL